MFGGCLGPGGHSGSLAHFPLEGGGAASWSCGLRRLLLAAPGLQGLAMLPSPYFIPLIIYELSRCETQIEL